jgi:hypothetical protein
MLKFSKTNQISVFLKENKESDGIFGNIHLLKWNPKNYLFIGQTSVKWPREGTMVQGNTLHQI